MSRKQAYNLTTIGGFSIGRSRDPDEPCLHPSTFIWLSFRNQGGPGAPKGAVPWLTLNARYGSWGRGARMRAGGVAIALTGAIHALGPFLPTAGRSLFPGPRASSAGHPARARQCARRVKASWCRRRAGGDPRGGFCRSEERSARLGGPLSPRCLTVHGPLVLPLPTAGRVLRIVDDPE